MELKKFNNTDLQVSPICLGTVNYGSLMDEKQSKFQLSQYLDLGGNFIDTAHVYGDWAEGKTSPSEKIIGQWFKETGNREKVVLCTKGAHPKWTAMNISRVHASDITKDLNESLSYLNTDYIDLYFLHRDDPQVPVSEIIDTLDDAVKAGKIRYYGCSNWSLNRIKEAAGYARRKGSKGFVCNQLLISLADVNFYGMKDKTLVCMDKETHSYMAKEQMNAMAFMSIAKGYFTRRRNGENLPSSVTDVYQNVVNDLIYDIGCAVEDKKEYSLMDLSLMFVMSDKDIPTTPIASFDTPEQLETGISCWNKSIPQELMDVFRSMKQYIHY